MRTSSSLQVALAVTSVLLGSCDPPPPSGPQHLSDWDLFLDPANQIPAPGVVPYAIIYPIRVAPGAP